VQSFTEIVTPAMAAEWLAKNTSNRNLNKRLVNDYARDMESGSWVLNGEAVKIGTDGILLDGQHRLAALVQANVAVEMLLVIDLDPKAQDTMDTGRKRSFNDVLSIKGVANSASVASVAKRMWAWDNGDIKFSGNVKPTTAELNAWIAANPSVHRSAEIATRTRKGFRAVSQSTAGTAHNMFNRIDPDDTAEFFARFASGAGLPEGSPILTLRNRMMRDAAEGRRQGDMVKIGMMIKAWNYYRKGQTLNRLEMHNDSIMPIPE
jgi:hypothetical protein